MGEVPRIVQQKGPPTRRAREGLPRRGNAQTYVSDAGSWKENRHRDRWKYAPSAGSPGLVAKWRQLTVRGFARSRARLLPVLRVSPRAASGIERRRRERRLVAGECPKKENTPPRCPILLNGPTITPSPVLLGIMQHRHLGEAHTSRGSRSVQLSPPGVINTSELAAASFRRRLPVRVPMFTRPRQQHVWSDRGGASWSLRD